MLENKNAFLKKFNIPESDFKKTKLKWSDLDEIYKDYSDKVTHLSSIGQTISNALQVQTGVHSVRYRIKDPEHLIEKIIRKVKEKPSRKINISNYDSEITDLVGVRAIHLFKSNWMPVSDYIKATWESHEQPIAYIRKGDAVETLKVFESNGFLVKEHDVGYRSLHYIIKTKPTKTEFKVEIQVRTLFEEGWSEIDHKIRYPYDVDNDLVRNLLMIFNRLAGSADEMADYVQMLSSSLKQRELEYAVALESREVEINSLKEEINRLKLKPEEKNRLLVSLDQLTQGYTPYGINIPKTSYMNSVIYDPIGSGYYGSRLQGIGEILTGIGNLRTDLDSYRIDNSIVKSASFPTPKIVEDEDKP